MVIASKITDTSRAEYLAWGWMLLPLARVKCAHSRAARWVPLPASIGSSHQLIEREVPARHPSLPFPSFFCSSSSFLIFFLASSTSALDSVPALSKALFRAIRVAAQDKVRFSLSRCQLFHAWFANSTGFFLCSSSCTS
jgi:hypothetical protein